MNPATNSTMSSSYVTLLRYVTPSYARLGSIMVLLTLNGLASLANPWLAGLLTHTFLTGPDGASLSYRTILLLWLVLVAVKSLLGFFSSYLVGNAGADMSARLRRRVYEHLQILPLTYYQERSQGKLLTLLSHDAGIISGFVTGTLVRLLPLTMTFLGALLMMAWLDPIVALLAVALLPLYYVAMKLVGRKIRPITSAWVESWSNLVNLAQENLGLMPSIKAFVREHIENRRFDEKNTELLQLTRRQIVIQSALTPLVGFLAGAGLLLLLWVGISHVQSGRLATSELVTLILYAILMTQPLSGLANVYGQVMRTRGAAERLLGLFAERPEPLSPGKPPLPPVRGNIEFRGISFGYPGREPVFDHFDLAVRAGETIALTGPNGSGKTTLAHLLMRFIEPDDGRILIDGVDIATVDISSLRDQIGLVAQQTLLLNSTIAENIAYGRPMATEQDIVAAAEAALADSFIRELPHGYATLIGDQGVRLSGGQRQRISLARTLLKNPPILVLDEATAMMDAASEAGFFAHCAELFHGRTVLFITHRVTGLDFVDRIVRIDLPQAGSHGGPESTAGAAGREAVRSARTPGQ